MRRRRDRESIDNYLFWNFTQRNTERLGDSCAIVCWIGLEAIADMANLNLARRAAEKTGLLMVY